jgi:hypothetical protein
VESKSILWKYLLLKITYIFLRDSYACPSWIFIFDSDQAQINSAGVHLWALGSQKLTAETVKSYVFGLSHLQQVFGFEGIQLKTIPAAKSILKGAKLWEWAVGT